MNGWAGGRSKEFWVFSLPVLPSNQAEDREDWDQAYHANQGDAPDCTVRCVMHAYQAYRADCTIHSGPFPQATTAGARRAGDPRAAHAALFT